MIRLTLVLAIFTFALTAYAKDGDKKDGKKNGKPAEGKELLALDDLLHGRVTKLKGDVIEILYDFSTEEQMKDWLSVKIFRVDGKLKLNYESKGVKLDGTGCLVHQIAFTEQVDIEFDCKPWLEKDFGGIIAEDGQSDHFVIYAVNDIQFQKFDGGTKPGHMVCRFGIIDPSEPEGTYPFRYVVRGKAPEIVKYRNLRLVCKKDGKMDEFSIGDHTYRGREPGRAMLDLVAGVYVAKSGMLVDNITVRGKISPRWLESVGAEIRLKTPPRPVKVSPADIAAREKIKAFKKGEAEAFDLFDVIEDEAVSEDIREEVAEALIATANPKLVTSVVSLLYSGDVITRGLANDIVKALTGKSFGFNAKDNDAKRSKAIQKILKHVKKYEKKYQ